jgi:predicted RNA-binding protein YlqC (UPF0109 family)
LGDAWSATQFHGRQHHPESPQESSRDAGSVKFCVETFLEFVIRQLVEAPEEVLVTKVEQGRKLIFKVEMRKSDVGKVIGRNGHTITAVRNLLSAAASRTGQHVLLQIVE